MKYFAYVSPFALLAAALSTGVAAQDDMSIEQGRNPSVTHLMQTYGISESEAQMRIDLQTEIIALSERLNASGDPTYGDMYIQHEPVYKIVIRFSDTADRKAFLESVDPKIRRYVQLKNVNRSRQRIDEELDELTASLNALDFDYIGGYDLADEVFQITVDTAGEADRVKALVPARLKREVRVVVGEVPTVEAAPYGVQSGDYVHGGLTIRTGADSTSPRCTLGYTVSYISGGVSKRGVLSAGHCNSTMYYSVNGHYVTLHSPIVKHDSEASGSSRYDYQIWETTGLTNTNKVYFRNLEGIPEFPSSGTFNLTSITTFMNQKAGMVVCKSGAVTGITCGEIVDGNALFDGLRGWIEVSKTRQSDISAGGDSGGPWFLYPGSASNINGFGVHTAGAGTGPSSTAIYMPIDYIDDHISSVNTVKQ